MNINIYFNIGFLFRRFILKVTHALQHSTQSDKQRFHAKRPLPVLFQTVDVRLRSMLHTASLRVHVLLRVVISERTHGDIHE